ncbi:protein-methionine-sulfoxide reductase heme-binding subunit MsrQ [Orrella sp. JC864]|uniref:sulfite oxidase heme-binding subunit YedZ n=1 Tax=Orrella sp. JC864 TaxID=3120298 RepID=UPI00300B1079
MGIARPAALDARTVDRLKPLLFALGLFPLARWFWLGWQGGLGANPVEFLTRSSGTWTLVCLLATLAVTPLRRLLGAPALVRLRRMCGLFAFFYASLHCLAWAGWEQGFSAAGMWADFLQRPFVTVGLTAFALMALLALTSTRGWMRRLGPRWQALHRSVYAVGVLAIVHYWLHKAGKNDFAEVWLYGGVLAALLGWRAWHAARQRAARPR